MCVASHVHFTVYFCLICVSVFVNFLLSVLNSCVFVCPEIPSVYSEESVYTSKYENNLYEHKFADA